ncbi:hypothetical protein [Pseudalkalibacillus hwajinpoensis]|nr:hypothetical protein [Pseudalkalibacillus hwajinpoensis]
MKDLPDIAQNVLKDYCSLVEEKLPYTLQALDAYIKYKRYIRRYNFDNDY